MCAADRLPQRPPVSLPAIPAPPAPLSGGQQTWARARRLPSRPGPFALHEGALRAEFGEACRGKVAVEGERFLDALGPHEGEARRIDEGVLALVVLAQPRMELVKSRSTSLATA